MEKNSIPYFRFWEKDLVKGYHYIFADSHVDVWANTDINYNISHYTIVLHVPSRPELLEIAFCPPDKIKEIQNLFVNSSCIENLCFNIDRIKKLGYFPK